MIRSPFGLEDVLADRALDNALLEVPLPPRVFRVFLGLAGVLALAVGLKVAHLALVRYSFYEARAQANITDVRVEPAPRGVIRDRFGLALVQNVPSWSVVLVPRDLPVDPDLRGSIIDRLASLLGEDVAALRAKIARKDWSVSDRLVLSDSLSQEALLIFSTETIPGVRLERSFQRIHKDPLAYAHLVGYTGRVDGDDLTKNPTLGPEGVIGRAGIEAAYDDYLRGRDGRTVTYWNARGEEQGDAQYEAPAPGAEVRTFIDGALQEFLYERFTRALRELGRTTGAALAIDPRSGEVRALVSIPSFESTKVAEYLSASGNPLFNRVVQGVYNPGSTIKPLVGLAALTEGVVRPETEIFSAGFIEVPNPYNPSSPSRFLDNKAHGWVNIRSALAKSSNIYFYEVAGGFEGQRGVGIETLKRWWERFGLGSPTAIDLPEEKTGFLPDPEWKEEEKGEPWRVGDTYNVAIGQGDLLVTPLELLNYIAAVGNGGTLWKLRVVRAVVEPARPDARLNDSFGQDTGRSGGGGEVKFTNEPKALSNFGDLLGTALAEVRKGMEDVVRAPYGTAHSLSDLPIVVSAKTGTAQIEGNTKLNAFFVGYAPAEAPELALLILVEDAREGSLNTIPVARDVFLWYYNERMSAPSHAP
ncbi:MAG: penicillin-binding transpeptidase domain-containing protein [Candidatus Jorgensenbacteria bacterium]|nr:penicillin-binding transpeptidase domain-containing protein [Candidatus Jorgensenbacteria bacterium]